MIDPKKIEQIARQVHESMPKGIREFGEDVEKKIRQTLQSQLTRLDLVSREEFDVQTQVLLRTREKLALLEQRLTELESREKTAEVKPAGRRVMLSPPWPRSPHGHRWTLMSTMLRSQMVRCGLRVEGGRRQASLARSVARM